MQMYWRVSCGTSASWKLLIRRFRSTNGKSHQKHKHYVIKRWLYCKATNKAHLISSNIACFRTQCLHRMLHSHCFLVQEKIFHSSHIYTISTLNNKYSGLYRKQGIRISWVYIKCKPCDHRSQSKTKFITKDELRLFQTYTSETILLYIHSLIYITCKQNNKYSPVCINE